MTHRRQGNVAIIVSVSLVALIGFAALCIDLGYARVVHQQLQVASDAAAHAGSLKLNGTDAGLTAARTAAITVAAANQAAGAPVTITDSDVEIGVWDSAARTFTPSLVAADVNTVQVHARLPHVGLFFSPAAFAQADIPISASSSVAAGHSGASAVDCFIPLSIADCLIDRNGLDALQSVTLNLAPAGVDNMGWARPWGTPNSNYSVSQINDCHYSGEIAIGDPIGLQTGAVVSAMDAIAAKISSSTTMWSTSKWGILPPRITGSAVSAANYGKTYQGVIIVVDAPSNYCDGTGGAWNQTLPLKGFVWGSIYDVKTMASGATKTIRMRLDVRSEYDVGTRGGGPNWGITATDPPRLVDGG